MCENPEKGAFESGKKFAFDKVVMKLITVEQMEAATQKLLELGSQVGADSWQQRVKNQTPHCKFGEEGTCCRICSMGPCRITPKAPRGICGCDVHGIVARNYLRFTAGGSATHSDHGREICHTLYQTREGGNYTVKDPEKLKRIAGEWGIETEGKDIYDLAHEVAETALMEYGKPFGIQRFLSRAPEHTQKLWHDAGIEPRAIDREVSQSLHMTHMGCSSLPEALIRQSLRSGLSDGWGGSMCGTEFSDVMFGTPKPVDTEANLYQTREGGNYTVKDPEKLKRIAGEWGIETEGKDIYDLAHEVAETALMEYGKPFGIQRFLSRAPEHTQKLWHDAGIEPRAIDREVSQSLHMTHMGCSSLPEALIRQSLRSGLSDGWGGSMCGTEFSDVMFGTPKPVDTEANLGVMEKDMVNIVVHGHDPSLSEMIVHYAQDPEMIALAKAEGAKGINICGVCCTANEVAMRHGIPMAGNFLQQENVVLTGACEAIVVDVQCIFPALGPLSKCFHTKFITTSPVARMPDSDFIEFHAENAGENAKAIVKMAVENFKNRDQDRVFIPDMKIEATVGYSLEAIKKCLDGVTNTQVDVTGTTKPLVECVKSGVLRGAVAMVGCNNPKIRPDYAHIELMKKLLANDIILVVSLACLLMRPALAAA